MNDCTPFHSNTTAMKFFVIFSDGREKKEFERAIFAMIHANIYGGKFVSEPDSK